MNSILSRVAVPLGACLLAGSALAIDFAPTAVIDGVTYTVGATGSPVQRLGDALSFSLPQGVAIGTTKTINLTYGVSATPGQLLASATQTPTGQTTGAGTASFGTVFASPTTSETFNVVYGDTGPNGAFPVATKTFATPVAAFTTVRTAITLAATGTDVSKASAYTVNFSQRPVPEPMTLGVLATGLFGLAARRNRRGNRS